MIHVQWDNDEQTIVVFTFDGTWTWQDFRDACDESRKLHDAVSHQVASIFDMREANDLPTNFFSQVRYALDVTDPPNRTKTQLVIGAGFLIRSLGEVFQRLYGSRYGFALAFVSSPEQAYEMALTELQSLTAPKK
jgi:hypothetical protein